MKLSEIWLWYCEQHIPAVATPGTEGLSPEKVLEDFWTFHPLFTGRTGVISATPYSTDFDDAADDALAQMALEDSFASWEGISAGTWRVLQERFVYCSTVVAANMAAGKEVIDHLPSGLPPKARARALLLRYLLGHGRTIDRRLLPKAPIGSAPQFPASAPIRRQ